MTPGSILSLFVVIKPPLPFSLKSVSSLIDYQIQWFLTFFDPWTPKSQNNVHGPLKSHYILLADPLIPVKDVHQMSTCTVLYFSDL